MGMYNIDNANYNIGFVNVHIFLVYFLRNGSAIDRIVVQDNRYIDQIKIMLAFMLLIMRSYWNLAIYQ